ncbi:flagellar basal-body rod protein FlgG [Desulfotomaculum arcticum]|uniref:Flagellar basal-body rod protein FlgG n=1 Tax=Desulfotruncus arcticus DSM 17038 TaxID=1121424 RepID=A0A1I2MXH5_9FIRM|nr:flagellar hook-basal body protein [Desulfotruncus arcticus]SFF96264.1 flagellar basal-body rod protein FlgG [Desulfotomaculum arcticum] [Desulfotruncus arcticus DSM 17038]
MIKALHNGMTGMAAQMQQMDVIGNNIANIDTNGYKRQTASFDELLRQQVTAQGMPVVPDAATESNQGGGAKISSTNRSFTQGNLINTGRDLDLAIDGDGFFNLTSADGEIFYTRDGSFKLDSDGLIKNSEGYVLLDNELPEGFTDLVIDESGLVSCKDGEGNTQEIGQIELAVFPRPELLEAIGNNMFKQSDSSGEPETVTPGDDNQNRILQNYLEGSNIDLVQEVQSLIEGQRSFQLNAKSVNTADQLWSITNNLQK